MKVLGPIDRGGFGRVDRVELPSGEVVARKVFDPSPGIAHDAALVAKARRRFIREVTVQAAINHPNIMPITDSDLQVDPPWFTMPLAMGSLATSVQQCKKGAAFPLDAILQMLTGIEELHRLGYVHRDLKPENVLDLNGRWVLADFGLVLPQAGTTTTLTGANSAWGTTMYAAPELATDFGNVDHLADIFSVGSILHDFFGTTARIPYHRCSCAGAIGPVIEKCTATMPGDRFPDVSSLRSAILLQLANPVAPPTTPAVKTWLGLLLQDPITLTDDDWARLLLYIETTFGDVDTDTLLYAIDISQIRAMHAISPTHLNRYAVSMCKWIATGGFGFTYCDALGARLMAVYSHGTVRTKADATMAAFTMGCSHNRFAVMRLFVRMASPSIDESLADRLAIEMVVLGPEANDRMDRIDSAIGASRSLLHPKITAALATIQ